MRFISILCFIGMLSGACIPMSYKSRFEPVGVVGRDMVQAEIAKVEVQEEAVQLYVGTAPAGFALDGNVLTVASGYEHQVLGRVTVVYKMGFCDIGKARQADVLEEMQERAAEEGGNAVIFARSEVSDDMRSRERCDIPTENYDRAYGSGWIVKLQSTEQSGVSMQGFVSPAETTQKEVQFLNPDSRL